MYRCERYTSAAVVCTCCNGPSVCIDFYITNVTMASVSLLKPEITRQMTKSTKPFGYLNTDPSVGDLVYIVLFAYIVL